MQEWSRVRWQQMQRSSFRRNSWATPSTTARRVLCFCSSRRRLSHALIVVIWRLLRARFSSIRISSASSQRSAPLRTSALHANSACTAGIASPSTAISLFASSLPRLHPASTSLPLSTTQWLHLLLTIRYAHLVRVAMPRLKLPRYRSTIHTLITSGICTIRAIRASLRQHARVPM